MTLILIDCIGLIIIPVITLKQSFTARRSFLYGILVKSSMPTKCNIWNNQCLLRKWIVWCYDMFQHQLSFGPAELLKVPLWSCAKRLRVISDVFISSPCKHQVSRELRSHGRSISARLRCQMFHFLKCYPNNGEVKNQLEEDRESMVGEEGPLSSAWLI